MKKLAFFAALIFLFSLTARAQVATPYLDANENSTGPAAAGWRYTGIVSVYGAVLTDSKVTSNMNTIAEDRKIGDIKKIGLPFATAAFRSQNFGGEFFYSPEVRKEVNAEWVYDPALSVFSLKTIETKANLRLNLAYVFAEELSLGLGYWSEEEKLREKQSLLSITDDKTITNRDVGSLMVSWRLSDVIYLAGGVEKETQKKEMNSVDYVDNSWMNSVFAAGIVAGAPEESQFRVECAITKSPESVEKADGDKLEFAHPEIIFTQASLEAKFGGFLISYRTDKEDAKEVKNNDNKQVYERSTAGLGWMPFEGLSVMAYFETEKKTKSLGTTEAVLKGSGYGVSVGWLFK